MIISAHQPAYIPWLGYFHKIILSDVFIILDNVQFEKNSFINRNKLKSSNGETWITVPLKMNGHMDKMISDMEVDNSKHWNKKHWNTIYLNYKKADYFKVYQDQLEQIYLKERTSLIEITDEITKFILEVLEIDTKIIYQSELKIESKKQELIMEICKKMQGDLFIFGEQGKNYVNKEYFQKNKIDVYFQEYFHPRYNQLWGDFIPNLGIFDVIFNEGGKKAKEIIISQNIDKTRLIMRG